MRLHKLYQPRITDKNYGMGAKPVLTATAKTFKTCFAALALLLIAIVPAKRGYAQAVSRTSYIYAGTSPFQDSLWTFDVSDFSVRDRVGPTLSGFTITGMNGVATDPTTGEHYVIMKLSGISGRVLGKIDIRTGVCTQVGNLGDNFATLAFNANGSLFGVTGDGATIPETMYRIDKTNGSKTLFRTLGNGADGEVIAYCADNNYFYHWSGNGTVVWERFDTTGIDAIQPLTYASSPGGETFGALYIGDGKFLVSNISSHFKMWDTTGYVGSDTSNNPDDIRGLVRQAATTIIDPWGPLDICAGSSVGLEVTGTASGFQWYQDGSPIPGETNSVYMASAAGVYNCVYMDNNGIIDSPATGLVVTVKPLPTLSSGTTPSAICNNTLFAYNAASATSGATFAWSRDLIAGISNPAATGGASISETLVNTSTDPIAVAYSYTVSANGCDNVEFVTVAVNPTPLLFPPPSLTPSMCSGGTFTFTQNSLTTGTMYSWSRAAVTGISNPAGTGTGNINEVLTNTTPDPITVMYVDTLDINGCKHTETLSVVVNPTPVLTSTLTPASICDNTVFDYNPSSATAGTTYTWERFVVTGIGNAYASGLDTINETLDNISDNPVTVVYAVTLSANSCSNIQNVSVVVNPTPVLSSSLTPPAQCDSSIFNYPPTSNTTGATFAWKRLAITGISNPANTGTGNPGERLRNITSAPIAVTYTYTLTIGGCTNIQNVVVTVNPKPTLSNTPPTPICDSTVFTFTPVSTTLGSTYAWSRSFTAGISALPGSGTNNPNELLDNTTNTNVTVVYVYTITANGCSNIQNVSVVVHPTPLLSSKLTDSACSGTPYTYYATSNLTPTVSYAWSRAAVTGITPATGASTLTNGVIKETLVNSTPGAVNVTYVYTLSVGSGTSVCTNKQNLLVKVRPTTVPGVISITPPSALCSGTMYQNFGAADPAPSGATYSWSATGGATIQATGNTGQYAIVNFPTPGTSVITLSNSIVSTGCIGAATYTVNVSSSATTTPHVIYNAGKFICLRNDVKTFQWGYDDVHSLDSTILAKETAQSYFNAAADFANNKYWVMTTTGDGCMQKTYYDTPPGGKVVNDNTGFAEMSVFPNPASDKINVEVNTTATGNITIELVNMVGQVVNSINTDNHNTSINIVNLPAGVYMVDSYLEGIKIGAAKFVKN